MKALKSKKITSELKKNLNLLYIASFENKPIGYLKLNWDKHKPGRGSRSRNSSYLCCKRISRKKIGQLLLAKALEIAQNKI
jgi:hypothetical protein